MSARAGPSITEYATLSSLNNYLLKTDATTTYLSRSDASSLYATLSSSNNYLLRNSTKIQLRNSTKIKHTYNLQILTL